MSAAGIRDRLAHKLLPQLGEAAEGQTEEDNEDVEGGLAFSTAIGVVAQEYAALPLLQPLLSSSVHATLFLACSSLRTHLMLLAQLQHGHSLGTLQDGRGAGRSAQV